VSESAHLESTTVVPKPETDPLQSAKRFNRFGKIVYVVCVVVFNVVFWSVALAEFYTPAEHYLNVEDK